MIHLINQFNMLIKHKPRRQNVNVQNGKYDEW